MGLGVGIDNTNKTSNVSDDKPDSTCQTDDPSPTETTSASEEPQPSTSGFDPGDSQKQTCGTVESELKSKPPKGESLTKQTLQATGQNPLTGSSVVIKLSRLDLAGMESITVTQEMLDSMPKSKYSVLQETTTPA